MFFREFFVFAIGLASFPLAAHAIGPLPTCGNYDLSGIFHCDARFACTLKIYPRSGSEMVVMLDQSSYEFKRFDGLWVKAKILITDNTKTAKGNLKSMPQAIRANNSLSAVKILKEAKCSL